MTGTTPSVEVGGWSPERAVALVDGKSLVAVSRHGEHVLWRCFTCGDQRDTPTCAHARAFASTPTPGPTTAGTTTKETH